MDEWVEAGPNQADVPPDPRIELLHQLQHYWISTPPIQTQNTLETIEEKCIHLHVHVQPHKTFVKYTYSVQKLVEARIYFQILPVQIQINYTYKNRTMMAWTH